MNGTATLRTKPFTALPVPPPWLGGVELEFWETVTRDYELDPAAVAQLELACSALTRFRQAREVLDAEGLTVEGRFGPKQHPMVVVERDSRLAALRALRELDLEGATLPAPKVRGR